MIRYDLHAENINFCRQRKACPSLLRAPLLYHLGRCGRFPKNVRCPEIDYSVINGPMERSFDAVREMIKADKGHYSCALEFLSRQSANPKEALLKMIDESYCPPYIMSPANRMERYKKY